MSIHPYRTFPEFLRGHLDGKVQKISVNAGFTCPNRDGSKGFGGCTYCNNQTFHPDYCRTEKSIARQLDEGIAFFSRKYPSMSYLAYFQAYTNTYGELGHLMDCYREALSVEGVRGLVIGTRPDCMPESLLDELERLACQTFVLVEYGVESTLDRTLELIHRGHDHACTEDAIRRTAARGLPVGAHIILGLPGESMEDMVGHAETLSRLPLSTIKLHQLQLVRGTLMAHQAKKDPEFLTLPSAEEYVEIVCDFLERLRPDIAVERFVSQSPPDLLLAPDWGLKNYEFTHRILQRLEQRGTRQGSFWKE